MLKVKREIIVVEENVMLKMSIIDQQVLFSGVLPACFFTPKAA